MTWTCLYSMSKHLIRDVNFSSLGVKHSLLDFKTSYTWCDLVLTWCQTFIKCQCILYMMWTYPYLESNNHHPWCQNIMYIMWTCPWCLCSLLDVNAFYKWFELFFTWCLTKLVYFRLSSGCRPNAYFVAGVVYLSAYIVIGVNTFGGTFLRKRITAWWCCVRTLYVVIKEIVKYRCIKVWQFV